MNNTTTRSNSVTALARSLSLSVGTVSQAINGHPAVAARTRERVLEAAQKAGYVANRQAVALRTKKTHVIGLLLPTLRNPIYIERVASIQAFALEKGYEISFATSEWKPEQEAALAKHFMGMSVDALIIDGHLGMTREKSQLVFAPLINRRIPMLQIAHGERGVLPGITRIRMDVTAGICESMEHLIALGHEHIGTVGIQSDHERMHGSQRRGIDQAMLNTRKKVQIEYIASTASSEKMAYDAVTERLAQQGPFPTAIQTVSDQVALGVLKALHDAGKRIPQDVSVIGFDNLAASAYYQPGLTTVSQTHLNLGLRAVEAILSQMDQGKSVKPVKSVSKNSVESDGSSEQASAGTDDGHISGNPDSHIIDLKLQLVIRQSTGPAPRAEL